MVDFINKELYTQDSVDKQLQITFDGGTITNTEIPSEQFELTESLSSDSQLVFGSCEASEIKFRIYNVFTPLKDKWLTVTQILNGNTKNPLQIGRYKVFSDKPTADRNYRDVVAYDSMYDIIRADMSSWYNGLSFPMSLKQFRNAFFDYFEIDQEDSSLINDDMVVEKTINPEVLSGKDVIQSICEINGCFGNIGRDGKFQYITLKATGEGLYPAEDVYPSDDLVPKDSTSTKIDSSLYISCEYEDFITQYIDGVWIRQQEGDVGGSSGKRSGKENVYVIENNFLVYGKGTDELNLIADNVLSQIDEVSYRPFNAEVVGNPCFEVGDAIRLFTKYEVVETYILNRTLSGVQSLRDDISADGEENITENVNDIQSQIIQLKGKTNTLERTVEETKSTIIDLENGLQTQITQTADSIRSEVSAIEKSLQEQIDNSLGQYSGSEVPTVNNYPANQWTTTELKDKAIGSLYFVNSEGGNYAGFAYRWEKLSDGTYQWALLKDTEITQALKELQELQNKLAEEYSTTVEMNSAIEQTKEIITSTVAKSTKSYDFSDFAGTISYYNYGHPLNNYPADETTAGKYYLDASTGTIYTCIYRGTSYGWFAVRTLPLVEENLRSEIEQTAESIRLEVADEINELSSEIEQTAESIRLEVADETNELSSEIEQTAESIRLEVSDIEDELSSRIEQTVKSISLTVNNGDKTAGIVITLKNEDETTEKVSGTIEMTGIVAFNDLKNKGQTVINGSNITTGEINCDLLSGGTIKGQAIDSCFINGSFISASNLAAIGTTIMESIQLGGTETISSLIYLNAIPGIINQGLSDCLEVSGELKVQQGITNLGEFYSPGIYNSTVDKNPNVYVGEQGRLRRISSSSKRYKKDITDKIKSELDCKNLLNATIYQYKFKDGYLESEDIHNGEDVIGFIVENLEKHYPIAIEYTHDEDGNIVAENWNARYIIPPMLKLIQEQHQQLEIQQKEIDTLKEHVSFLMEKLGGNLDG